MQKTAFGRQGVRLSNPHFGFAERRPPRPHPRSGPEAPVTPIAA